MAIKKSYTVSFSNERLINFIKRSAKNKGITPSGYIIMCVCAYSAIEGYRNG